MDIFRFTNPTVPMKMEKGIFINNLKSKMWIERYREAGEFKLVAPATSDIINSLPIGSFISHIDTTEVMIVENHEITQNSNSEPEITITGRGFETFLENRMVGTNKAFPVSGTLTDYYIGSTNTWNQAVALIANHISASILLNDDDAIPFLTIMNSVPGTGVQIARTFKRISVYAAALDLLSIDNVGMKIIRPGPWSPLGALPNLIIMMHKGVDHTSDIVISHDSGEIDRADYLWSNKPFKNAAYVTGKWVETMVIPTATEYARRMMHVDASDIDQDYTVAPTGATLTTVVADMQQRGREVLAAQTNIALVKAEVNKDAVKHIFRKDYNVGDLALVSGDYNQASVVRITEYVEIEDETGESGYPTLTIE